MGNFFKKVFKYLRIEEVIVIISALILFPLNFIIFGTYSVPIMIKDFARYFFPTGAVYEIFLLGLYVVLFFAVYKLIVTSAVDYFFSKKKVSKESILITVKQIWEPVRVILTLGVSVGAFYFLFHNMNIYFIHTQADYLLLKADNFIFSSSPFITVANLFSSQTANIVLWYGYISLVLLINVSLLTVFLISKRTFRIALLSFIFAFIFAFPIFAMLPCQDPSHFFVLNDHNYDFPKKVDNQMMTYKPSVYLQGSVNELSSMETSENGSVPISCIPSMHTVWALLSVYALAMISLWTLLITLPWTVLTLTGGLYLAQHYAIDYIVAIPITILSIVMAHLFFKLEEKIKNK